ncbi:ATP-binding protein [Streptomyces iconiensis]|uniref:ATP-binding protein n=1 Tax=Streptomyces iconiensis TaxID=1384038 RepID=A0ABT7A9Z3_9ACTN|nr:ATP-binding protein [Streptomyces iconiensis]MDJ1138158.1 ATP-binding protein [Streptomyces iconiensis]
MSVFRVGAEQACRSEVLPREAESAGAARALVRGVLVGWGLEQLVEDGAVVVTELVANAVHHTRSHSLWVTVTRTGEGRVRLGVVDASRALPRLRSAAQTDVRGRGLALVEALASRWGTDIEGGGKCVWAELAVEGVSEGRHRRGRSGEPYEPVPDN